MEWTILRNGRNREGDPIDVEITEGRIVALRSASTAPMADREVDLDGRLVLPLLVNGHAHLDKTFLGTEWQPHVPGSSVIERIKIEKRLRADLVESAGDRERLLAERMIEFGTGALRTHVDVDAALGLSGLERMLKLREDLRGLLDIQLVAFPQSGIVRDPGSYELLEEAIRLGAEVIGGIDPIGIDGDMDGHLDAVFGLADRRGAMIDIHLHAVGDDAVREYRGIITRTRALGMEGRVVLSHAFGLGALGAREQEEIFNALAELRIAIMSNGPAGLMPPVKQLAEQGVIVFAGSDNVRDAWWPFGSGDVLDVARNIACRSGFLRDEDLGLALDLATSNGACALGLPMCGPKVGQPADLLVVDAGSAAEAVANPPVGRDVMRSGEWVSRRRLHTVSGPTNRRESPAQFTSALS